MGFHHHYVHGPRLIPRLMGSASGATALLGAEADGLSIDFTDASLIVRDTTTTSNAWLRSTGDVQDFWRSRSFTSYASPSPKITRDSDGNYTYRPHNLATMSEKFALAAWTKTRTSISSDTTTAPDGTATADTLIEDTSGTTHLASQVATVTNGAKYTWSIYAKAKERTFLTLYASTGASQGYYFNLGAGTRGTAISTPDNGTIESIGSGWYRCTISVTAGSTSMTLTVGMGDADNNNNYTGDGASGLYIWGAMLNAGPTALTYVPTRAHNLCIQSQTLDNAAWTATSITVSANSVAAPDGTTTAETLALVDASAVHSVNSTALSVTTGLSYTVSVYAKANTHNFLQLTVSSAAFGTEVYANFNVSAGTVGTYGSSTTAAITGVGNGWYRCSITGLCTSTTTTVHSLGLVTDASAARAPTWDPNSTNSLYAWGAQVELASSAGKYTATTTAAVYSANYDLPREWDSSGVCQGLLVEEARTNICLYASDLTNAAWTKSNMTTALTATGPDGVANTATTCTATAANATAKQSITSGSAARITSMFVKRRTGSGNIDLTQDDGTTWATMTVTSSWTRVNIASVTSTNPIVGIRIVTDTDAVDIALFQHEVGAFITSPIYTGSASVTRAVDVVTAAVTVFPFNTSESTLYGRGQTFATTATFPGLAGVDRNDGSANAIMVLFNAATGAGLVEMAATTTQASISESASSTGKIAGSFKANEVRGSINGSVEAEDVSATMASSLTTLRIGRNYSTTQVLNGWVRQVMYKPGTDSLAELQALTT
jgi:hypothetical protein